MQLSAFHPLGISFWNLKKNKKTSFCTKQIRRPIFFNFSGRGQPLFSNFHSMGPPIIKKDAAVPGGDTDISGTALSHMSISG